MTACRLRTVQATPVRPCAAREVSGRSVVLGGLITLALNAGCVLSVLGDQIGALGEMLAISLLVVSILGVLAIALHPWLSATFSWIRTDGRRPRRPGN
ncbi:hypothetical protein ACVIF9_000701 [Bradyrhizobium sp. USDA 4350]